MCEHDVIVTYIYCIQGQGTPCLRAWCPRCVGMAPPDQLLNATAAVAAATAAAALMFGARRPSDSSFSLAPFGGQETHRAGWPPSSEKMLPNL